MFREPSFIVHQCCGSLSGDRKLLIRNREIEKYFPGMESESDFVIFIYSSSEKSVNRSSVQVFEEKLNASIWALSPKLEVVEGIIQLESS